MAFHRGDQTWRGSFAFLLGVAVNPGIILFHQLDKSRAAQLPFPRRYFGALYFPGGQIGNE